jgi:DNA-binding NarL/FixJ family response regulator
MRKARILLGDDHPLVVQGSRASLEECYEIVGTAPDGQKLTEAALRLKPDLILLDISMPLLSGIEVARRVKASLPGVKLLFLTMHTDRTYLRVAFEAGGTGYLLKSAPPDDLLTAVSRVLAGHTYISNELSVPQGPNLDQIAKSVDLSAREQEVLQLIAQGWSGKEIAGVLNLATRTVAFHRENIKRKLGVKTIAGLVRYALARDPMA